MTFLPLVKPQPLNFFFGGRKELFLRGMGVSCVRVRVCPACSPLSEQSITLLLLLLLFTRRGRSEAGEQEYETKIVHAI